MKTLAITDNAVMTRRGVCSFLQACFPDDTVLAGETVEALALAYPDATPDVMILGVNQLSYPLTVRLITLAQKTYPQAALVLYDDRINSAMIVEYLRLGVVGYLHKLNPEEELRNCISEILEGRRFIFSNGLEYLLDIREYSVPRMEIKTLLSPDEIEVALHLAKGLSVSGIARRLDQRTSRIRTTKLHIFQKLNVSNLFELKQALDRCAEYRTA